jgi:hypothetical protein
MAAKYVYTTERPHPGYGCFVNLTRNCTFVLLPLIQNTITKHPNTFIKEWIFSFFWGQASATVSNYQLGDLQKNSNVIINCWP